MEKTHIKARLYDRCQPGITANHAACGGVTFNGGCDDIIEVCACPCHNDLRFGLKVLDDGKGNYTVYGDYGNLTTNIVDFYSLSDMLRMSQGQSR